VIKAFNDDKPFDRFIKEQVAGDELWPDSQEARIATGFLAGYPDNANSRDLVQRKYQITTDITDTIGETFLASTTAAPVATIHKSDKVSQKEYFQLQAFFANTAFDQRAAGQGTETDGTRSSPSSRPSTARPPRRSATSRRRSSSLIGSGHQVPEGALPHRQPRIHLQAREEWNALDRWVNFRHKSVFNPDTDTAGYLRLTAENKDQPTITPDRVTAWKEYQKLQAELRKFDNLRPIGGSVNITTATELGHSDSPPTFVRFRRHSRASHRGSPAGHPDPVGRRQARDHADRQFVRPPHRLANWLASPNNPLTARVYEPGVEPVLRQGHRPTVADFGRAGEKPTNPALLDYLASSFREERLERQEAAQGDPAVGVYRQSSEERATWPSSTRRTSCWRSIRASASRLRKSAMPCCMRPVS
jgi:hypothetical protein